MRCFKAPRFAAVLAALFSLSLSASAATPKGSCPKGQTLSHGKCVTACATDDAFTNPNDCECPAGFGKILMGNGTGMCDHLLCPTNVAFDAKMVCECPPNYEKTKPAKGQFRCDLHKAKSK